MTEKEKEELLKKLLKNLLEERLSRLEKRNLEQMKDIKFEKDSYKKQELLVNKFSTIKIEPKKLNQSKNNHERGNRTNRNRDRSRDTTPNNLRAFHKRNNSIKKQVRTHRNMTPDVKIRRRGVEKKDNAKTEIKVIKKPVKKNNNNIPSYMMGTSSNANKTRRSNNNDRNINDRAKTGKRARTADVKKKVKTTIRRPNKVNDNIENNLKLIDLKIDDMKEHVPIQDIKIKEKKEEEKIEEKPEIKEEKITFDKLIEDKIIKKTSLFLDEQSRYNFYSCNKKLIKYLQEKLSNELTTLEIANNISEYSTAQDQINSLKLKYSSDQFEIEPPKFSLSRGTVKAIELLNNGEYGKIFDDKELLPPLDGIIFIYRIFFQFWKDSDIKNIQDQKLFWIEASNFILKNSNGKIGDFFRDSVENFEFSGKNIYEAKKLINGKEDQLKPAYFTKICGTTGLVVFLIKDTLEYCGVLLSLKKNVPSICLKYLEYIAEMQSKMKNYIENISAWRDNA